MRTMNTRSAFAGKHALITGGSIGIGAAVASRLVRLGSGVTLIARGADALAATAARIAREAPGVTVRTLSLDVGDEAAVAEAIPRELAAQPADLVVNNAGVAHAGRFMETDPERFRTLMDVNYFGTLWMCRAAVPHLRERGGGHLVNVASMAAIEGIYGYSAYAPSKFAVYGLTQVLRAELKPHGIGVSVVLPPNTDTAQLATEIEQIPHEMKRIHQTSSVISPEDVAEALLRGVARGRFEIIPGLEGRVLNALHRASHKPLRAYFDWHVRRAMDG
jgi:3-dehydrosphinganine reductase